jgi:hypothetical protein
MDQGLEGKTNHDVAVAIQSDAGTEASGRERRESERALSAWEATLTELGRHPTLQEIFAAIDTEEWSYGFVVAVDAVVEVSSLLTYGTNFARLLDMPPKGMPFVRMARQLPQEYAQVFLRACTDACRRNEPLHVEGEVDREGGRRELYRAVFIPIEAESDAPMRYAFGRFNSRLADK